MNRIMRKLGDVIYSGLLIILCVLVLEIIQIRFLEIIMVFVTIAAISLFFINFIMVLDLAVDDMKK